MVSLVQHHIKYKEFHGVDEIVLLPKDEHVRLHNRLRKEGRCKVPVNILTKVSTDAHHRTAKSKQKKRVYAKKSRVYFSFSTSLGENTRVLERIRYNPLTGNVVFETFFRDGYGCRVPTFEERLPMKGESIDFPKPPRMIFGLLEVGC